jgi:GNAT superfamily N-acetyltransferase
VTDADGLTHLQLADIAATMRRLRRSAPAGIHLRAASLPTDLPVIAELYNAVFESGEPGRMTAGEFASLTRHPGISPTGMFLAFAGDLAVGLAVGSVDVPAPGGPAQQGAIEVLAVRPGYRRRGIGRALLHAVLAWLAAQGVEQVSVGTEDPALADLLIRYGFGPAT